MAGEFAHVAISKLHYFLEPLANPHQYLFALFRASTFSPSARTLASSRDALAYCPRPQPDSVEGFPHVDHYAHHLAVVVVFKHLSDRSEHDMQPQLVDDRLCRLSVLECVCPFASMLVLLVFPFGSYPRLEEMVVGFDGQIRHGRDIVVDAPELLDRVECDDLFKKIIPIIVLKYSRSEMCEKRVLSPATYLSGRRLCKPQRPAVSERVLDVEIVGIMKNSDYF